MNKRILLYCLILSMYTSKTSTEFKTESTKKCKCLINYKKNNCEFKLSLMNDTEGYYAKGTQLFSNSELDKVAYIQTSWDLASYFKIKDCLKSKILLHNLSTWGNGFIAQTTENGVKIADATTQEHQHFLGRQIFWLKEGWFEIALNSVFNIKTCLNNYLKLGAFSFTLGRGISLGDAYAVSPGILGFYEDDLVDQYAFGILLNGGLIKDKLDYYLYYGLLENKSDKFENVNKKIYANAIGKKEHPQRGFGKIDFVIATKLLWTILNQKEHCAKLTVEPYFLYNRDPEQKVEFFADAKSYLITLGLACEYVGEKFEFGFDLAKNGGHQKVRGWDRNKIEIQRNQSNAFLQEVYTQVLDKVYTDTNAQKALVTETNKEIVKVSDQNPELNGKQIAPDLWNNIYRFRGAYKNKYKGFMFVTDAAYKFTNHFKIAATLGWATGDENPNLDIDDPNDSNVDGDYKGFIPLQEIYTGQRVKSLFVIGTNKLPGLVSPSLEETKKIHDPFSSVLDTFTNIVFIGTGATWKFCTNDIRFKINPNLSFYWQDHPTKKFDRKTKKSSLEYASKFIGTELNCFTYMQLLRNLKFFIIGGWFIPGTHYDDLKGKPLDNELLEELDDETDKSVPTLSNHSAFTINMGFEYTF